MTYEKKRILFNSTTNIMGGPLKNSALFIKHILIKGKGDIKWFFAVSLPVFELLKSWGVENDRIFVFHKSPSKDKKSRKHLIAIIEQNNINAVYTMAGPAYVNFNIKHILGISNPYITHSDIRSFLVFGDLFSILKRFLLTLYQMYYARMADHWIFQTEESKKNFCKRLFISEKKTYVIPNAFDRIFIDDYKNWLQKGKEVIKPNKNFVIFCPGADYYHKAYVTIPSIAKELKEIADYKFNFILTLKKSGKVWKKVKKRIKKNKVCDVVKNIGSYSYEEVYGLYEKAEIVFVPSILETFSATYLEAFASGKPLVVSNKKFSREICKDAAVYVNPYKSKKAALLIDKLIKDVNLQDNLKKKGYERLKSFPSQEERANRIIKLLKKVLDSET